MSQRRLLASYWSLIAGALCTDVRPKRIITYLFITFTFLYIIMQQIIFTCETVTPMFLAGADGSTPELRPPSIKGALRFWWRALNGHLSIEELKKREGAIFGDTTQRSKVIIRVEEIAGKPLEQYKGKAQPLPHHADKPKNFKIPCVRKTFQFKVILISKSLDFTIKQLANLFLITISLGGLGKRSRRGFGSIKIVSNNDYQMPTNLNEIKDLLNNVANQQKFSCQDNIVKATYDTTDKQYPCIETIQLGNKKSDLLYQIGKKSSEHNSDYTGFARPKYRLASPIWVSCLGDDSTPIITQLKTVFPDEDKERGSNTKAEAFISDLIK